jgi:hypothetical protein
MQADDQRWRTIADSSGNGPVDSAAPAENGRNPRACLIRGGKKTRFLLKKA